MKLLVEDSEGTQQCWPLLDIPVLVLQKFYLSSDSSSKNQVWFQFRLYQLKLKSTVRTCQTRMWPHLRLSILPKRAIWEPLNMNPIMRTLNTNLLNVPTHYVRELATYEPNLVSSYCLLAQDSLLLPIWFVIQLKVFHSHQIMNVITLGILFRILRSIINVK